MSAGHELLLKTHRGLEFTVSVHADDGDINASLRELDRGGFGAALLVFARGDGWWRGCATEIWIGRTCFELAAADVAKVAAFLEAHAPRTQVANG